MDDKLIGCCLESAAHSGIAIIGIDGNPAGVFSEASLSARGSDFSSHFFVDGQNDAGRLRRVLRRLHGIEDISESLLTHDAQVAMMSFYAGNAASDRVGRDLMSDARAIRMGWRASVGNREAGNPYIAPDFEEEVRRFARRTCSTMGRFVGEFGRLPKLSDWTRQRGARLRLAIWSAMNGQRGNQFMWTGVDRFALFYDQSAELDVTARFSQLWSVLRQMGLELEDGKPWLCNSGMASVETPRLDQLDQYADLIVDSVLNG